MFPRAFVLSAGLGLVSVLAGCFTSPSDPTNDPENVDLLVTAAVTSVVAVVVVEVTAPDIETPLAFNLDVVDGTASGTITVPAGSDRTITVTASDSKGIDTHQGSVTVDISAGENDPIQITILPLAGDQPIQVVIATLAITITPSAATIAVGETVALAAEVRDPDGLVAATVNWASLAPAIATVDADGIVTGHAPGDAQIVATYAGVGGSAEITVTGGFDTAPAHIQCRDKNGEWQDNGSCSYVALPVNSTFALTFRVLNAALQPIPNVVLTFDVDETVNNTMTQGGTVVPETATTDAAGEATVDWTIGEFLGNNRLLAQVASLGSVGVWVTGLVNGSALSFDGIAQFVEVADADDLDLSTEWTMEAWIKPRNVSGGFQHLVSKWGGCSVASYSMELNGAKLRNGIASCANGTQVTESIADLVVGQWQHVAVTLSGGTLRLFINGTEDNMITGSQAPLPTTTPISVGRQSGGGLAYNGLIDELRIWNVARTEAELQAAMSIRLSGTETGLIGYWQFDEGTGDTAADATGNGHAGRLGASVGADTDDPDWTTDTPPVVAN